MKRLLLLASLAACGPEKNTDTTVDLTTGGATTGDASTGLTTPTTGEPGTAATSLVSTSTDTGAPSETTSGGVTDTPTSVGPTTGDTEGVDETQVPPITGKVAMRAWLLAGHYKLWHCEPAAHDPLPVSPHGKNRICSNDLLSGHGDGVYPVDAAAVKELYDDAGDAVVGFAVSRHVEPGTTGDAWYWYEEVPLDSPAPHDADGIVADGLGDSGPALSICVGCHQAAGSDADHPGHDFVYVQVQ